MAASAIAPAGGGGVMMEALANQHFLRPYWLLLLIPAAILGLMLWRQRGREASWSRVVAPELLSHLITSESVARSRSGLPLLLLAWCLGSIGAAGPSWQQLPQPVLQKQDALVLVMDLSYSMYATDLQPTRADRVRRKLMDLLRERREGLTALIAYAGDAHIVAPLTDDNPTIGNLLPALNPAMMPLPGSNPVEAVERALDLLDSAGVRQGRILLVTDGIEEQEAGAVASLMTDEARRLSVLGVGTEVGAPIALPGGGFLRDETGEIVVPALQESPLKDLAKRSNGRYERLSVDDQDIDRLLDDSLIPDLNETIDLDRRADQWQDMAHWIVLPLLLIALGSFRRGWIYMLPLAVTLAPVPRSEALEWEDLWLRKDQQAQRALAEGDAATAAELFENPRWRGSAAYEAGEYEDASKAFSAGDSADDWYNRGNALAGQGEYDKAIKAYEESLARDSDREDALKNIETINNLKEQQQQSQQGQSQDQSQDQSNQQQNEGDGEQQQQESGEQQNQDQQSENQQNSESNSQNQQGQQQSESDQNQDSQQNQQQQGQDNEEQEGSQGDEQQSEQSGGQPMPQPDIDTSNMQEDIEKDQAMQQWLRRVPDDPSGLLREKFRYESRQRQQQGSNRETTKIW